MTDRRPARPGFAASCKPRVKVDWQQRGLPCSINPALFHDDGEPERVKIAKQVVAKQICAGCHVQPECLAHALDHREDHGVWGGMTADERQNLLNKKVSR